MSFTLEALFKDVAARRGVLKGGTDGQSPAEYAEVWDSYIRYLKSCLEQKRGLHLHNFCKIGWVTYKRRSGNPDFRPVCQFTEQFCRSCHLTPEVIRKLLKAPAGDVCQMEDFNFSKASIKFSNQLTKDQVFGALKALVQRLGEAIAEGRDIQVTFGDVGRLSTRGGEAREPQFAFSAEFLAREGIDLTARPGTGASAGGEAPGGARMGAIAFRKEAPAEAQGLGVFSASGNGGGDGSGLLAPLPENREPLMEPHYAALPQQAAPRSFTPHEPLMTPPQSPGLAASASAPLLTPARTPTSNLTSAQYKKEVAYKEAMDRHICAMEARAAEAIAERQAWQSHMDECLAQERDEITSKRSRAQTNLHYIKHQIQMGEEKKREQRKEDIATASAHDFPNFAVADKSGSKEFVVEQQARMRDELDEQVRTNNTLRNLAKQRERMLELNQLRANKEEMALLRNAERAKKAYDREALATAWNSDIRMKNIWKAIDNHSKVGSQTSSHPPQVLPIDGLPPPSRASSVASAGRLMTGNTRRVPLGASTSLSRLDVR